MAPSLRDIPGANQPRKRFASNRDVFTPSRSPLVDMTPRGMRLERTRRRSFGPSRQLDIGRWVLGLAILAVVVWLGTAFWSAKQIEADLAGLDSGAVLTPEAARGLRSEARRVEKE